MLLPTDPSISLHAVSSPITLNFRTNINDLQIAVLLHSCIYIPYSLSALIVIACFTAVNNDHILANRLVDSTLDFELPY